MKKIFLLLFALYTSYCSFGQSTPQFILPDVNSKPDLNAAAKKATDYILATPADTTATMRRQAEGFLFAWMEKTDEYSFSMDYTFAKIVEDSKSEGYVFMAAMVECVLKDKSQADEQVKITAIKRLIEYSKNLNNKLPPGPELQKAIKADKKGHLKKYLAEAK